MLFLKYQCEHLREGKAKGESPREGDKLMFVNVEVCCQGKTDQ